MNVLLWLLIVTYIVGWVYTVFVFWQYGIEHGSKERSFIAPLPSAILLALFWPIIMSLMYYSKE